MAAIAGNPTVSFTRRIGPTDLNGSEVSCLKSFVRSPSGVLSPSGATSSRPRSTLHSSTRMAFTSWGAVICCKSFCTSACDAVSGDFSNERTAPSPATVAVLVVMLFADCCKRVESYCVRFCKRSRPHSRAEAFTARYEAQLHALMTPARSVPSRRGRRYLSEMFESENLVLLSLDSDIPCSIKTPSQKLPQIGGAINGRYSMGR